MGLFDDIGSLLNRLKVYFLGAGVMHLAILAAAATGVAWVLPVVAIGGVALTVFNEFFREGQYQDQMLNLYRDDIAQQFGIAPEQVTRDHLKQAAKSNDIIDQALTRQRHRTWIAIGTAALSSLTTVLLVGAFDLGNGLHTLAETSTKGSALGSTLARFVGVGTVAGISSLIFNTGLRTVINHKTGLSEGASHDGILQMEHDLNRGRAVTREQVYSIFANAKGPLRDRIIREYGESYDHMNFRERRAVLEQIGVSDAMQELANAINSGDLKPANLAYMLNEVQPHPRRAPQPQHEESEQRNNFVERLGLSPRKEATYTEQLNADRALETERGIA